MLKITGLLRKFGLILIILGISTLFQKEEINLKELHQYHLNNSPYQSTKHLGKIERFNQGLSPDRYHEEIYELTMDPTTGEPNYVNKQRVQRQIEESFQFKIGAVPGQDATTPWYTIGPNNHAGRTRAAIFDLADAPNYDRVIAGGVSGGLWQNTNIDNASQQWTQIAGVPGNLAVSVIVQDPTDTNIIYAGTGESYTSGDVAGNGIYKSTNGGANWTLIFGSSSGIATTTFNTGNNIYEVEGYFYVNDLEIWDHDNNPATQEHLYAALGFSFHSKMKSTWLDLFDFGLYRSTDGGTSWSLVNINHHVNTSVREQFNDIDVQAVTNRLWLATTNSYNGTQGGNFYFAEPDGSSTITRVSPTWTTTPTNVSRTEIAPSATNTNTHYILMSSGNPREANIFKTTDNFATISALPEPNDADTSISSTDFTRNQSFYDLEIEVDPNDDDIVYAGGINWHRSSDGGQNWEQISKWSNNPNMNTLNVSEVHADQHGLYFRPNDSNQAIVVNDGGLAYCSDLATASNTLNFTEMEGNFVTTQFYRVAQTPPDFPGTDMVFGGTQDNGTYRLDNPQTNTVAGNTVTGGDGAATFFDQVGGDYMISNYVYNNSIYRVTYDGSGNVSGQGELLTSIPDSEGSFINPAALDSYNDVYYSNAGSGGGSDTNNGKVRVITGVDGSSPSTFLMDAVPSAGTNYVTALEVSRHTTNTSLLYVGMRNGEVIKITNADSNGSETRTTIYNVAGSVSDIHIGETDNDIYVTYYNYGMNGNIVYSSDGGTTFTSKEGDLPDIPVFSILHNPYEAEEAIVGTELGVWKTLNFSSANPNWSVADEGMSDVAVHDMVFRGTSSTDNRVVAGTYGRGIYVGSFSANTNPPVTNTDSITLAEGGTATTTSNGATSVLTNDTDADGDSLSADLQSNPVNAAGAGFTVFSSTGTFTYTHDGSETTTDSFTYRAYDGTQYGSTVTVTINITPVNDCPTVANPIADFTAMEDDPDDVFDLSNLFADAENDVLNITSVNNANTGLLTATLNTNTLTLDYIDNQTGVATITINVSDGSCTTTQEVFVVTVVPQNDPPVGNVDTIQVDEGGTVTTTTANATSVLSNDTDLENDALTATLITPPQHGTLSIQTSGTFTYIHDGSETATDSFIYEVSDGLSTVQATGTISINRVNDCPTVASPSADITVNEDAPDNVIDVSTIFNDSDTLPTPNTLSYTVTHTNASLATVTLNSATLTIDYIDDQTGSMVVTVTVDDNAGCNTTVDSFNITVNAVNDPPNTVTDTLAVDEGGTVTVTTATNSSLLTNDTDSDGPNPISMQLVSTPQFGTLAWSGTGTFTYVHDGSETTTDSFSYNAYDGQDQGNVVVVNININPVNDCPQNTNTYSNTITEDSAGYTLNIGSVDTTDPDNTYPLASYTVTYTNASLATVTFDPNVGDPSFAPKLNQNGTMTGTVTISDGDAACTLEVPFVLIVTPLNDCPVVDNFIADVTANEDAPDMWIDIQNTFSDVESATLNYTVSSNDNTLVVPSVTATAIVLDFQDDAFGNASIIITADDGDTNCTTDDLFTVSVASINDGPTTNPDAISVVNAGSISVLNDGVTTSVLDNDVDPEGNALTAQLITGPVNGTLTLNANGTFGYQHDGSATTTDVFYYRASDGFINGNTTSVTIYINNPPVAVTDTIFVMEAGTASTTSDGSTSLLANDTDADGDALTAALATNPQYGTITINPNGTFNYVHNGASISSDNFTYTANDGKVTGAPVTVSIVVTGTNDPPIAANDVIIVPLNGTATTLDNGNTSLLANDSDPDGDALTATLVSSPSFGTLTLNPGGTFTYVQNGTLNSGDSFTYKVNDGTLDSGTATVNVYLSCSPTKNSIVEGGPNGVSFTYTDALCKTVRVYVPKRKAYSFCHLDGSIVLNAGTYTLITSTNCN